MVTRREAPVASIRLDAGNVALDFVNTLGGPRDEPPRPEDEFLRSYEDLLIWCRRVGRLSTRQASSMLTMAAGRPEDANNVLRRALALRSLLYDVFRPLAEGGKPRRELLERLREAERDALRHARLEPAAGGVRWSWPGADDELDAPLAPLTHAAVELLTHGPIERLKVCAACRWLFLDKSRNHSRRWCSMEECGTAVKKERFIERRRERRAAARAS